MTLNIGMEENSNRMLVTVAGEIDAEQRKTLKSGLEEGIQTYKPEAVVIDCRDLDYIDSTGLGVLVSSLKSVKDYGGTVSIINLKPFLLKVFRITGLDEIFELKELQA